MPVKVNGRKGSKGTPGPTGQRLTAQQVLFVDALCNNHFHGKSAAIAAGVAEKNAARQAAYWLDSIKFPQVQAAINKKMEERRNTAEVDGKRIIQELARIAFFDPKRLLGPDGKKPLALHEMPDDVAAALGNISVTYGEEQDGDGNYHVLKHIRYTPHDKLSALKQLASMLGLDNGEGMKVINNNTLNQIIINWNDLYKRSAGELSAHNPDPHGIEAAINAAGQPDVAPAPPNGKPLNVVTDND